VVGVAGSTLTEWCGLRAPMGVLETASEPLDEVDDAFECECRCRWMLRMLLTELLVDLRPRRPLEPRRKVERGVRGDGDKECLFVEEEPV
jgi:hypothetical protein